jgi:hypothetical protein
MKEREWNVTINYVNFESEDQRNNCYEKWVESFLNIEKKETKNVVLTKK